MGAFWPVDFSSAGDRPGRAMTAFQLPDASALLVPDASLIESFVRGSVVYLSLLVMFRVCLARQGGSIGLPDVMLVVLVSECVSNSLGAEAKSVPNGLAAVAAMLFWSYALDRLAYHSKWVRRVLEPGPLVLVRDGRPIRKNLKRARISDDELRAQLREQGVDGPGRVKLAVLESEGSVSVIPADDDGRKDALPDPSGQRKLAVLRRNFVEGRTVNDVCREFDVSVAEFGRWRDELFTQGSMSLRDDPRQPFRQDVLPDDKSNDRVGQ